MKNHSRGLAIDAPPVRGDVIVDLDGAFVLPGLINAHDHLELNHYGPLKGRDRYDNASAWIDDMRPRLQKDAAIRANRAFPLASRLFSTWQPAPRTQHAGDDAALAEGILVLLADPSRRERMAREAEQRARAHDADWTSKAIEEFYCSSLQRQ